MLLADECNRQHPLQKDAVSKYNRLAKLPAAKATAGRVQKCEDGDLSEKAPVGVEPTMADLQSAALASITVYRLRGL